jgi:insulysin
LWNIPREKGLDVRGAVLEFHRKYYSANLMTLVVLGSGTLDELQDLVEGIFSPVKNHEIELPVWTESPFGPEQLQTITRIVPIDEELRWLNVIFPVPDTAPHYKTKVIGKANVKTLD